MSDSLRPDLAQLVGLFVEAILYGVYLLTFAQVLRRILVISTPLSPSYPSSPLSQRHRDRILRHRRGSSGTTTTSVLRIKPLSRIHLPTLLVALLLWVNGTLNISLGMVRAAQTFVYRTGGTGFTWIGITKSFTVSVQVMLADGMLVYRCWRAYNKSTTIILLPMLLWIVGAGATIWTLYLNVNASGKQLYMGVQYPLSCVFWAFTMGLNIYTTCESMKYPFFSVQAHLRCSATIIYRIWSVDQETLRPRYDTTSSSSYADSSHSTLREPPRNPAVILLTRRTHSRLQGAIKIVFTSGLIYTLTSITVFASEIAKSNSIYITSAAVSFNSYYCPHVLRSFFHHPTKLVLIAYLLSYRT